jgi:hypothetical protein
VTADARYDSKFDPGEKVRVEQWLAEYMCERAARSAGVELPLRFWRTDPVWEKKYAHQLRSAKTLLKLYDPKAISLALRSPQGKKVYSLAAKWFDDLVKVEQGRLNTHAVLKQEAAVRREVQAPAADPSLPTTRPAFSGGKSTLSKLEGL